MGKIYRGKGTIHLPGRISPDHLCVLKFLQMQYLFVFILAFTLSIASRAQETFFQADGKAIRGFDPVSYFLSGKAEKGSPEFNYSWGQANWTFSSREHLEIFRANPEKFAPQFGGFCAYGASEKHKAPTDPEAWTIVNGKLYLNYSHKVRQLWLPDTATRIPAAINYWNSLKQ